MTPYAFIKFLEYHHMERWSPLHLAYLGLLPSTVAQMHYYRNCLAKTPYKYYKEVFRK